MLLDEDLPPVTTGVAYLFGDPAEVVSSFMDWQRPLLDRRGIRLDRVEIGARSARSLLCSAFPILATVERTRYLFVPHSDGSGVAVFDNSAQAPDPSSVAAVMYARLRSGRAIAVRQVADVPTEPSYGATTLEVFDVAAGPSGVRRSLFCANDGGRWTFGDVGEPFPFEDTSGYQARRVRDRFTSETLRSYTDELGAPVFDGSAFDLGACSVVTKHGALPPRLVEMPFSACG